jgi:hypothetical protein
MKRIAAFLALAGTCGLLLSCNPVLSGPLPSGMVDTAVVQHVPYTGSFSYTVDPGAAPRDVYFVFTNPSLTANASQKPTISGASLTVDGKSLPAPSAQPLPSNDSAPQSMADRIAELNRNPYAYLPKAPLARGLTPAPQSAQVVSPAGSDVANVTTGTLYTSLDTSAPVSATCRAVVGPVVFADGRTRSLSIWVDDTYWTSGEVTATMVNALADRFIKGPTENTADIYHWDTAVVGEPWGPQSFSNLIAWDPNNTITILLTHLNSSYAGPSYTVGFFWSKDNFTAASLAGSNQRIMFYIDSRLYWMLSGSESVHGAPTNYWPKIIFSTLAHEFQHMIQFYQKVIVHNLSQGADTWINEMCSMLMEDLVAQNQSVEGPRGVLTGDAGTSPITQGRLPQFNAASGTSLAVANSGFGIINYAVSYTFGAWLIRNYGGPDLLRRIVQGPQTDSQAVVDAAGAFSGKTETIEMLLEQWAASVLLSDTTSAPSGYRYNTGGWSNFTVGSESFSLGSIDVFNYSPTLTVYSRASPILAPPSSSSNIYYLAASKLGQSQTFSVTLPAGVEMSVVLK